MRPRLQVVFLGITSLLLYLFLTKISTEFNWGEGYADRPILTYLGIYFSLSLIFFTACFILSKQSNDRFIFWTMIVFGLLFRFAILPAQQIQEDAVYRYLWDGKVFSNNINPFEYSPSEVIILKNYEFRTLKVITKSITKEMNVN